MIHPNTGFLCLYETAALLAHQCLNLIRLVGHMVVQDDLADIFQQGSVFRSSRIQQRSREVEIAFSISAGSLKCLATS